MTLRPVIAIAVACAASAASATEAIPWQPTVQTATLGLIWLCQLLIVGMPPMSWLKLSAEDERSARLWFTGLLAASSSALVLGLLQRANVISGLTMVVGAGLFLEAMRREAGMPPLQWRWVSLPLTGLFLGYLAIEWLGLYPSFGVALTSLALSVLEGALAYTIITVAWSVRSRGLLMVLLGIFPVFFVNAVRLVQFLVSGRAQPLFSGLPLSNAILLAFTIHILLITVGYLSYMLEKTHRRHMRDLEAAAARALAEHRSHEAELQQAKEAAETLNQTLEEANRRLGLAATVDNLTGLGNRRRFDQVVAAEMAKANRHGLALSLVLLDVDHFKTVNDTHGHLVGDRVLVELSVLARDAIRTSDQLFRWGGEEFLLLLPSTGLDGAVAAAEKLRSTFASHRIPGVGVVTGSFGVAAYQPGESQDAWMRRVDRALYAAKASGRNVVNVVG